MRDAKNGAGRRYAHITDIICHANVLCVRSPYFRACLGGEWNEAQTKTVEINLENDQAVQDLKLLLKLCYSDSYIKDEDELLDRSTRIRLAFLGNAFEMQECVGECLGSLADDLTPTDALTFLDDVPEELHGHDAMKSVTAKVVEILANRIDERSCPQTSGVIWNGSRKWRSRNLPTKAPGSSMAMILPPPSRTPKLGHCPPADGRSTILHLPAP